MPQPTVLLIDDDATQLKLGRLRLKDAAFNVVTAGSGDEALAKLAHFVPSVILSDVLMGDIDGFALCRRLRAQPAFDRVPIILLSSHYTEGPDQELAAGVGAFALVARTPDFQAELETLRRSLAGGSAPSSDSTLDTYESHVRTTSSKLTQLIEKVRDAEQRYRALFESARDCIALLSEDGRILEVNDRWYHLMGLTPMQLVGRHIREFAAAGHELENLAGFRTSPDGSTRATLRHRDGRPLHIDFSNSSIDVDGKTVIVSIGRDVTEAVEAARSQAEAEHRYRSLVERLPDAIWTMRQDGTVTFVTQNIVTVTGYTPAEFQASTLEQRMQRMHPDDAPAFLAGFRGFAERGERFDIEYRFRQLDGHWVWLRNRATARYERDGVLFVEGMITDVTERKVLEQSLRQAQKMEAIGQLTGGIAHDFNNILGAILASAHFLTEDLLEGDPRREDAVAIETAAHRAAALTKQLLAFSRQQVLDPKVMSLDRTVVGMENMLRRLLDEHIELTVRTNSDEAHVRVDESQLEQVVMNLVVNARDAMPTGGRLTVETSTVVLDEAAGAQIEVPPGHYAVLSVCDTGTGMDGEVRRRIFEPFFTTKPAGHGTGLGLSTCYGIVKQSGGYLWVETVVNGGSTFYVYLPRAEQMPSAEPHPVDARDLRGREMILVVEDDDRVRSVVCRILAARGYQVVSAANGRDALDVLARQSRAVDLVLTDVMMPVMDGPALVRALRESRPDLKAIFMSGHTSHFTLDEADLINLVHKPFTNDAIALKLREALDR